MDYNNNKDTSNKSKDKIVTALKYNSSMNAPKVVASGKDYIAEKILDTAKENNIPIEKNPELASLLSNLSIGDEIPEELYNAVAQILFYIGELDKSY